jgi:5-methylcytosine-specific restriction protein A
LGLKTANEAFKKIGSKLNISPTSISRRRDEFDALLSTDYRQRVGYNKKIPVPKVAEYKKEFDNYTFEQIGTMIKQFLVAEDQYINDEQFEIQNEYPATEKFAQEYNSIPYDDKIKTSGIIVIKRNASIAKKVLVDNKYSCLCDETHKTFFTNKNVEYMEGHHLIPCTIENSKYISEKFGSRLDREENIVCICPNCHRAIHFGNTEVKKCILRNLYDRQKEKLFSAGIKISFDELISFYK